MAKARRKSPKTKRRVKKQAPKRRAPAQRKSPVFAYQPPSPQRSGDGSGMMLVGIVILIAIIVGIFMSLDEKTKRDIFGGTTDVPETTTSAPSGMGGGMSGGAIAGIVIFVIVVLVLGGAFQQDFRGSRTAAGDMGGRARATARDYYNKGSENIGKLRRQAKIPEDV